MSPHDPQSSHAQLAAALETVSRLEQQLREAQKMQALGLLAGGIAHDFNNLLTVMNGYSGMLLSTGDLPEAARKSIAIIRDAGDRAAALVRQLLVFSRRIPQEPHIVDLNESVSELGRLVSRLLPASIQFTTVLEPNLSMVLADPGCIQQALLNLVLNSRDAMPEGGKLVIETANLEMDEDYRASHPGVPPAVVSGPYALLTVRDTGIGMDEAVRKHVFEPFFTTKKSGAGTGLGLSTVHGIVTQAGGWVWVDSKPGGGATFKMLLPRSQGAPRAERVVRPAPAGLRGSETVLVVEDQEAVRRLARTALESYGYAVLEAANGQDALLMIERHTGRIDLLLSDVVMPGMTGPELAVRLRTSWPEIKVLCMSGYTAEAPSVWGMEGSSVAFIPKPFTPDALATKVREVLAGAWPAASILVVDDEDSIRSLFTLTLTGAGYKVVDAKDGREALERLREERFDVLVTDLVMPEGEGIETIRMVRKEQPDLKIVAVSGVFGGRFLRVAHALGAHATLAKPVSLDALLGTIQSVLAGDHAHGESAANKLGE